MIAALYVETNGCYYGLPNVDPWDKDRDARKYPGPYRIVAHPPCEHWGRYARENLGNDDGCFAAAYASLCRFGGVLEHPEGSSAWPAFDIPKPPRKGSWIQAGKLGLWTCCVEQGHYGHRARKATWLLCTGNEPPPLAWGPSRYEPTRKMREAKTEDELRRAIKTGVVQNMSAKQRRATPIGFRNLLLKLAGMRRSEIYGYRDAR